MRVENYMNLLESVVSLQEIGNRAILNKEKLALFCSVKCLGDIILKTYDLAKILRDKGIVVISGFRSPMEKECLRIKDSGEHSWVTDFQQKYGIK